MAAGHTPDIAIAAAPIWVYRTLLLMLVEYPNSKPVRYALLVLLVIAGGIVIFKFPALQNRYRDWKHGNSLDQAKKFAAAKDYPNAELAINNAFKRDPGNSEVCRLAADLMEQTGNNQAVMMRKRVVALAPREVARRYELVRTALRFGDRLAAREAIEGLDASEQSSPEYRRATAALALANGQKERAAAILQNIAGLPPEDVAARLERAFIVLRKAGPAEADAARRELLELAAREDTQALALRELTLDAGRRREMSKSLEFAEKLVAAPKALFSDKILLANVRLAIGQTSLEAQLAPLQTEALAQPDNIPTLVSWLLSVDQASVALAWLESLPSAQQESSEILTARANCQMALNAWPEATVLIKRGAFGPVPPDAIQLALAARVLQDKDRPELQVSLWSEAIRATADNLDGLLVLNRLSASWSLAVENRATLLRIAERFPDQNWAHQALVQEYYQQKDTAGLRTVFRLWDKAQPGNPYVEGNRLFLELLTDPSAQAASLAADALRLRDRDPTNPFAVTNYALALWWQGRATEALAALETLSKDQLLEARRSLYHGLFLASLGHVNDTTFALGRVDANTLLPEEQELLRQARELQRKTMARSDSSSPAPKALPALPTPSNEAGALPVLR